MIEEPPLLTIKQPGNRPSAQQIAAFSGVPTSIVSDAMDGAGALNSAIRHLDGGRSLPPSAVGPALTVGCGPADILALLGALKVMAPGDMVVVSVDGHQGCAALGDRLTGMMKNARVAGVVTDGPVRDLEGITPVGLPLWCTGLTPASPYSNGPGTVGLPVRIGGNVVETGDIVVADLDGVVVVPSARIDAVAARAAQIIALEKTMEGDIDTGMIVPPDIETLLSSDKVRWVD